jgi:hypothetical protein
MEFLLPVLTGVFAFLIGQYVLQMVLAPVLEARTKLAKARETLDFHANIWANPPATGAEPPVPFRQAQDLASNELRRAGGAFRVIPSTILGYSWLRFLFGLPSPADLRTAGANFVGLSNSLWGSSSHSLEFVQRNSDTIKRTLRWE